MKNLVDCYVINNWFNEKIGVETTKVRRHLFPKFQKSLFLQKKKFMINLNKNFLLSLSAKCTEVLSVVG